MTGTVQGGRAWLQLSKYPVPGMISFDLHLKPMIPGSGWR